jgi:hypothetical protein
VRDASGALNDAKVEILGHLGHETLRSRVPEGKVART